MIQMIQMSGGDLVNANSPKWQGQSVSLNLAMTLDRYI